MDKIDKLHTYSGDCVYSYSFPFKIAFKVHLALCLFFMQSRNKDFSCNNANDMEI